MADKKKKVVPVGKPERASGQRKVAVPAGAGKTATSATGGRRTAPPSVGKGKGKKLGQAGSLGVARSYPGAIPVPGGQGSIGGEADYGGDMGPLPTPAQAIRATPVSAPRDETFTPIASAPVTGPRYNPVASPGAIIDSVIAPAPVAVKPAYQRASGATGTYTPGTPGPQVSTQTGFVLPKTSAQLGADAGNSVGSAVASRVALIQNTGRTPAVNASTGFVTAKTPIAPKPLTPQLKKLV